MISVAFGDYIKRRYIMREPYNRLRPISIGLDNFFNFATTLLEVDSKLETNMKFPPYNIYRLDNSTYQLEMALAGYKKEDMRITVENGILTISAEKQNVPEDSSKILYKGISSKSFTRSFPLSEDIVVKHAALSDGILTIELEKIIPEEKKVRTIHIN